MINHKLTNNSALITFTPEEPTTKHDPLYLQNLMYDLPFDTSTLEALTIQIAIPKKMSAYIIDDLHFIDTTNNKIEFVLHEASKLIYQFFVANHQLCDQCAKKELYDCQSIPEHFNKEITIALSEQEAQAYIKCHYLGDQDSKCKIKTVQHHQASNTISKLIVKGVLDNNAKLISDNTIVVDKYLTNIVAEQNNKNLMLNNNAHAISIPKLKVNSQQISCKHGATIHSLNQDELFYLQSRGIEIKESEKILVEAFLTQT